MAINVTLGEVKTQESKPFPKLMKDINGDIYYMVREKYGLPLTGVGWAYSQTNFADFSESRFSFTDYNEPITIQNA